MDAGGLPPGDGADRPPAGIGRPPGWLPVLLVLGFCSTWLWLSSSVSGIVFPLAEILGAVGVVIAVATVIHLGSALRGAHHCHWRYVVVPTVGASTLAIVTLGLNDTVRWHFAQGPLTAAAQQALADSREEFFDPADRRVGTYHPQDTSKINGIVRFSISGGGLLETYNLVYSPQREPFLEGETKQIAGPWWLETYH